MSKLSNSGGGKGGTGEGSSGSDPPVKVSPVSKPSSSGGGEDGPDDGGGGSDLPVMQEFGAGGSQLSPLDGRTSDDEDSAPEGDAPRSAS